MALFQYKAIGVDGKACQGVIEADSITHAKEKLRKDRVYMTDLIPVADRLTQLKLPDPLLLQFTQELAQLLSAGLPLYESLVTIEEKYRKHPKHSLFLDLCDHLKRGHHLSVALKKYSATFDQIYISMVQAAEQSGRLAEIFQQLAELLARSQKLKKKIVSTFTYPAFLGAFCFLIIGALLFFIIPSLSDLLEGRSLHPLTSCVLSTSHFANDHIAGLVSTGILLLLGGIYLSQATQAKKIFQSYCLRIPMIQTICLHVSLVRFFRSGALLLDGGVALLDALHLSRRVMKHPLLEKGIEQAEQLIVEGKKFSDALALDASMPPLVVRMMGLAEETGKMKDAFAHLAKIYEEELERQLTQLITFLQPMLLIVLGGLVGLVVLSILLPLTDVSSFMG